jgi:transcriptional regulator with XRE-family HTH domain
VTDHAKFFRELGQRVRDLRKQKGFTQEDMISFGFSARHWQQIEAGRPITVRTLLRIGEVFGISLASLVVGIDSQSTEIREESHGFNKPEPKNKK